MIYAAKTKATDSALTVGGIDGKLLNDVLAFESKAEYDKKLDQLWENGDNLIRISRKDVEGYFGRNFEVLPNGWVGCEGFSEQFTVEELEEMKA
jgi:hypothetical protein